MNWYSVFYWLTVDDVVKKFFDTASDVFTTFTIISLMGFIIMSIGYANAISSENSKTEDEDKVNPDIRSWKLGKKIFGSVMYISLALALITWCGFIFVPNKKDALLIITGGAVGNFITSDSSAKQIPAEAMTLLRDKIREEIKDVHIKDIIITDTLKNKTKEELLKIIKNQSEK
jgi:hypothetical protein